MAYPMARKAGIKNAGASARAMMMAVQAPMSVNHIRECPFVQGGKYLRMCGEEQR